MNGRPGENYWQNSAKYEIEVNLMPDQHKIIGSANITYFNNSPDTLAFVPLRLYPNLYKKGVARDFAVDTADLHDGVQITNLSAEGKKVTSREAGTNLIVNLDQPLLPDSKIQLKIDWSFTLPSISTIRHGVYGENEFFVAYWYPQVAVYDDIDGWDLYNYSGSQEFYNDFADFDVKITVPENFLVWATGTLQNPEKVLRKGILKKYKLAQSSNQIIHVIDKDDYQQMPVTVKKDMLVYHYKAENVTDFAFGCSDHYLWDASTLTLDNGQKVLISAAYNENSADFYDVAQIARSTIEYLSTDLPGIPYPYPQMTVFNGGGGMEFPMMCNDESTSTWKSTVSLTGHEIAHTYFPFYMGINEKKYAWMDEGWARKLPSGIQNSLAPEFDPLAVTTETYESVAGKELEVPIINPTIAISGIHVYRPTMRNNAYYKSGTAYHMLHLYLGDHLFKEALREFMDRWNGKHPLPYDFFFTFNQVAAQDLSWFWKPWFYETVYPDLGIQNVEKQDNNYKVTIERIGSLPVPVKITFVFADNTKEIVERKMDVWKNGEKTIEVLKSFDSDQLVTQIILGDDHIPDVNQENNSFEVP
ncbi:MAG: M1 family metallopeptidase [Cyclobacteriaceae bacterium]